MSRYHNEFENYYDDVEELYEEDEDNIDYEDEVAEHKEWEYFYHKIAQEIEDE